MYKGRQHALQGLLLYLAELVEKGRKFPPTSPFQYIKDFTPEAMRFIVEHGREFTPIVPRTRPDEEPETGECFRNAWFLAVRKPDEVCYVEGLAMGPLAYPMLHAWNTFGPNDHRAIDWTFYATTEWTRYFGIALTVHEYQQLCQALGESEEFKIFYKRNFGIKTRFHLRRILLARKQAGKRRPKEEGRG